MTAELLAALTYARMGLHVFPCKSDKTPLTRNGLKNATTDISQIREWWAHWPDAMIGLSCGPSGIVAIDVDVKNGVDGWGTMDMLMREHGELPGTRCAETPSGGCHMYYRVPADCLIRNSASKHGPGVDIRAEGGYTIAPPSESGCGAYTWAVDQKTARLPEAWVIALTPPRREPPPPPTFTNKPNKGRVESYSVAALQDEARALAAMRSGRNDELVKAAARLGSLVYLGGITEDDIRGALLWACSTWPDCNPRKDRDTIERGLRFGLDHPRKWGDESEAA